MKNIKAKINRLYPGQTDKTYNKLIKILNSFKKQEKEKKPFFSEKDIILICYADHVKERNTKTFKTMRKFLRQYAKPYVNKIHFLPFYPYSSDDGFSVIDYYQVNNPFGDWKDVKAINKDFSLMFDFVINHASVESKWFKEFLKGNKYYQDFFIAFDKEIDTSDIFRPRTSPLLTLFKDKYVWTTFSEDQADLNLKNPEVFLEIVRILLFYVQNGAEAIRLDAAAYIWKELKTSCFNLPQVHTFIQLIREIFEYIAPNVWIITETVLPHKENLQYLKKNEAHLAYNFVLETLFLTTLFKQDTTIATKWINTWKIPDKKTALLNLSVSHDSIHTIPAKGVVKKSDLEIIAKKCKKRGGRVLYRTTKTGKAPYEFNITYPSACGSPEAFLATQSIQLALKGVPLIYFNNFIGAENWEKGVEKLGYGRAINREKFDYGKLVKELENPKSDKYMIYRGYARLLKARINEPLFSPLASQKAIKIDSRIMAILRFKNKKQLLALTSVSNKKVILNNLKIKKILHKDVVRDIISKEKIKLDKKLTIHPYQTLWLN